jgi:hypothetical protein
MKALILQNPKSIRLTENTRNNTSVSSNLDTKLRPGLANHYHSRRRKNTSGGK